MFSSNPTPEEIFCARVFEEPMVPVGPDPTPAENAALAAALLRYSQRSAPDDFSSVTAFLESYPNSPWNAALLTNLGLEYYHAGHYSKTLQAWRQAWELGKMATDPKGKAIRDRAGGELAYMHARLGQMTELSAFLKSVDGHAFSGPATEKITGAREGLWNMENRPEIAFRCGPFALYRIKLSLDPANPGTELIHESASTQRGFSLSQVGELSEKLGLQFQMAYRAKDAAFVVPAVAHLKLDHFAAITQQEGNLYLLEDPTFGSDVWVTREALEAEASGYFLVPSGELPSGWRVVETCEGESVWGKGMVDAADPGPHGPCDPATPVGGGNGCSSCKGMAVSRVHLMPVSLNINDEAVGYSPPVGPQVRFTVRYNQREAAPFQPAIFSYSNLGPKWTFDWLSYIIGDSNTSDVHYYIMGGGNRTFTGFKPDPGSEGKTGTFAFQQLDQTLLTRTEPDKYEMLSRDGSKKIFGKSDGSLNSRTRRIFLTELIDPHGNAVLLNYDAGRSLFSVRDFINLSTFVARLRTEDDPVSKFLWNQFSPETQKVLKSATSTPEEQKSALVEALDNILKGASIFEAARFAGVTLSPETKELMSQNPKGKDLIRLNRLLLEDAYPLEIAKSLKGLRLIEITDAIEQVTKIFYEDPDDTFKITKVTDPFGRSATFEYKDGRLSKIKDVIDLTSEFTYDVDGSESDFIVKLTTPYGDTIFAQAAKVDHENGLFRMLETTYPDGDKDRVEFKQFRTTFPLPESDPWHTVPDGVTITNLFLQQRNTFYWDKKAYASAYVPDELAREVPDYTKARIYHWLHGIAHKPDFNWAAGILESVKEPLEGRVWFDYAGQFNNAIMVGSTNKPAHVGRVLDDGSTQLYTYEYNSFGNVTKEVDPVGRTFSYRYADNGIDLLEVRQTRAGQNELLLKRTYKAQHPHLPHTSTDAAGQTTIYTYNNFGQVETKTNAKNEKTTYKYDEKGHLKSIEGPLPGASIRFAYDPVGRVETRTDESEYTLTFDYDKLDRLTKITYPDNTFDQFTFERLDLSVILDRAKRKTTFKYNSIRQMTKRTDPLNRVTLFDWCKCGALRGLTDPMGRTTSWRHDIQGRVKCKEYADGSNVTYLYENTISRLRQRIDEKLQVTQYNYNRDDTVSRITYTNATVSNPSVAFTYDANYNRLRSMTDRTGTTLYDYIPITLTQTLGAGQLGSLEGPLPDDIITFGYDELGRRVSTAINGIVSSDSYDAAGRLATSTNPLGTFTYTYDGNSFRTSSQSHLNGHTVEYRYEDTSRDLHLRKITNKLENTPISEFTYESDVPRGRIASWSQQSGEQPPSIYSFDYDDGDQLKSASFSEGGNDVTFGYSYDPAGNRLIEQIDAATRRFSYNALNELTSVEGDSGHAAATYQWDAEHRLISVTSGNQVTEFTYDGFGRRVGIRSLVNGAEVSNRRFVWCDHEICEERTAMGVVMKRFFVQGIKVEDGPITGTYFYYRDHLGSIRELIDTDGNVRARFSYDPFGNRTGLSGDLDTDFGFAGMFWLAVASINLTRFRAYDPNLGRWLSRDPLNNAEVEEGINLFAYVQNDPVNRIDPLGLEQQGQADGLTAAEACKRAKKDASCVAGADCHCWKSGIVDTRGRYVPGYTCIATCKKAVC